MKMLHLDKVAVVTIATILISSVTYSAALLAVMSVDLGSEYMKIAIVKPGVPMEIVTNDDSARKTASMVVLRDGERLFGNAAQTMATRFPSKAFWYLTNIIGKKYEDPEVQKYKDRFPYYNLVKDEERGTVLFQVDDETQYSPEELLAMQLEKAKQYAETFADQTVKDAVITVPAYFSQAERRAIMMAVELSGLNILQIMGDNAAVALNYGVFRRKQFNSSMQYIMFFDMGASSTTASIVGYQEVKMKDGTGTRVVENPQLVIKGMGFDRNLGGLEASLRLRDHLAKHFNEKKKTKSDVYANQRAMAKLLKEAERVKRILSANTETNAQIEGLLDDEDFKMKVTRAELEHLCEDMFDRVTKPIEDALKASEITLLELSEVILMGGGTRVPKIQEILMKYLERSELGKSINTDEAAAMGAVYQAAHLGKGFKVLQFGVKEANVYPIVVEFEKQRTEDSTDPPRIIRRTLFGRMNPFPQKKVMTFNKHLKDFDFNVTYGDLDFMSEDQAEVFRKLQGQVHSISLKGVDDAYSKHTDDKSDPKGIKAHFRMDENGILSLEQVEAVFEIENVEEKEESAWSKIGDTIGNLFGSSEKADDTKVEEGAEKSEGKKADTNKAAGDDTKDKSGADKTSADNEEKKVPLPKESPDEDKKVEPTADEGKDEEKMEDKKTEDKKEEEKEAEKKEDKTEKKKDKTEKKKDKKEKEKDDGKKSDKKEKEEKKAEEEAEKKPKILIVKENITSDVLVVDITPPSKQAVKTSKKKLSDLTAKDKEKKLLEQAKNELEAFIYDMEDRLTQELYEKCSKEEERESINKHLADASDWLYDQEEDTKKEAFINKLKDLKKEVKDLEFRVEQLKERPEALEALRQMLNHSSFFLKSIQNLSAFEMEDDPIFTKVEVETLEKLVNDTQEWKDSIEKQQKKLEDHVKPVLLLEDIGLKIQALDREVKYLINKAKTFKPKAKPKPAKNKTEDKNKTVIDSETISANETKDSSEEPIKTEESQSGSASSDDAENVVPVPPVGDSEQPAAEDKTQTEEEPLQLGDGQEETTTAKPDETNTHDAGDL